jgi:16S rRNA (guanine527-N7)-methyltransferase
MARSNRRPASLRAGIEQLAASWELSPEAADRIETVIQQLATDPAAPTSVTDPLEVLDVHFRDSLTALALERFTELDSVVDIGSGVGFPGIALAIARPRASFDLLESVGRRCAFLERAVQAAGIENVRVVCARAEEWGAGEGREAYGGAVVRAVGPLSTLVEYAAPLLRIDGLLVAWKGKRDPAQERSAARAAGALGMQPVSIERVPGTKQRHLHLFRKDAVCPPGYPRRPGMAHKRPLGSR